MPYAAFSRSLCASYPPFDVAPHIAILPRKQYPFKKGKRSFMNKTQCGKSKVSRWYFL